MSIWKTYFRLHKNRKYDDSGPIRITYSDIRDWQDVTGRKLNGETIELLMDMETRYITTHTQERAFIREEIEAKRKREE